MDNREQAIAKARRAIPPAEVKHPKEAEFQIRREKAILDVMKRARRDLREQVKVLRRIIEYAVKGADLIDDMRKRGELLKHGQRQDLRGSEVLSLADLKLAPQRVDEWFSLRNFRALDYLDKAIADEREDTFRKASMNWIRERVERIARELDAETAAKSEPAYDNEIRHGDFRTALDDLAGQVDAIVTDPPYPGEYLDEYDALSEVAARLLKPGGILVAMVGHVHLPEYLRRLAQHLTYRWCAAYVAEGPAARVFARQVGTRWKPLLIFDTGADRRFLSQDVFYSRKPEKLIGGQIDGWQQSLSGMVDIVEHLTAPGDLVVDPFLGGGTTALACRRLGRRFVGCDLDADAVVIARQRMAQEAVP